MEYLAFGVVGVTTRDLRRGDYVAPRSDVRALRNLHLLDQETRDKTIYKMRRCMRYRVIRSTR